jgi:hypothetical protein
MHAQSLRASGRSNLLATSLRRSRPNLCGYDLHAGLCRILTAGSPLRHGPGRPRLMSLLRSPSVQARSKNAGSVVEQAPGGRVVDDEGPVVGHGHASGQMQCAAAPAERPVPVGVVERPGVLGAFAGHGQEHRVGGGEGGVAEGQPLVEVLIGRSVELRVSGDVGPGIMLLVQCRSGHARRWSLGLKATVAAYFSPTAAEASRIAVSVWPGVNSWPGTRLTANHDHPRDIRPSRGRRRSWRAGRSS